MYCVVGEAKPNATAEKHMKLLGLSTPVPKQQNLVLHALCVNQYKTSTEIEVKKPNIALGPWPSNPLRTKTVYL